jgi:Rrf2 family nitric oxide-sensitive transcriptional repressor
MRLTMRTNLAMRTLMFCAVNAGRTVRKHEVAEQCNASENHLAQVINSLAQMGFVTTVRGRNGGLKLGRAADRIRVGDVARAFETPVPFAECFSAETNTCPLSGNCRLQAALEAALEAFYASLDRISLADLVDENDGLHQLLSMGPRPAPVCTQTRRAVRSGQRVHVPSTP